LALDSALLELEPAPPAGAFKNLRKSTLKISRNIAVAASIINVPLEMVFGVVSKDFSLAVGVSPLLFDVLSVIGFPLKILEIMSAASNVPSGTSIKTGYKLTLKEAIKQLVSD
jgi:hypothetical protein